MRCAIIGIALGVLTSPAHAKRPISWCADVGIRFARPATAEWTTWIGGSAGVEHPAIGERTRTLEFRLGAAVDFSLARSGRLSYGRQLELRWGPWLGADTTFDHTAVEAGVALDLGMTSHSEFGDVGVRIGSGAGDLRDRIAQTASVTLLWGVRLVPARYSWGGGCVEGSDVRVTHAGTPARANALASVVRLFATVRADTDGNALWLAGIELAPGLLFPR